MEDWAAELQRGSPDTAWDLFLGRYRRLVFAAIRHYAQDYDDVMDVFARVCEALREDHLRRLRSWVEQPDHRARFSTWLVTVVRHVTVDWFRHRDGRRRIAAVAESLPPLRRRIFEHVFLHQKSHVEAYELLKTAEGLDLPFGPVNLGTPVNSQFAEFHPNLSFDGRTLVFIAGGARGGLGAFDIWMTTRTPRGK